ncbi:MAG: hypothetical protein HYZ37_10985 [Candidatus Solibacter usitatus]|nr:hypothetical protein [Candidatus Solibacter usitatus]
MGTSTADLKLRDEARRIDEKLKAIQVAMQGDSALARRNENLPLTISQRIQKISGNYRMSLSAPQKADLDSFQIAQNDLRAQIAALKPLLETDIKKLEKDLDAAGVPHTPGRMPELK